MDRVVPERSIETVCCSALFMCRFREKYDIRFHVIVGWIHVFDLFNGRLMTPEIDAVPVNKTGVLNEYVV